MPRVCLPRARLRSRPAPQHAHWQPSQPGCEHACMPMERGWRLRPVHHCSPAQPSGVPHTRRQRRLAPHLHLPLPVHAQQLLHTDDLLRVLQRRLERVRPLAAVQVAHDVVHLHCTQQGAVGGGGRVRRDTRPEAHAARPPAACTHALAGTRTFRNTATATTSSTVWYASFHQPRHPAASSCTQPPRKSTALRPRPASARPAFGLLSPIYKLSCQVSGECHCRAKHQSF